MTSRRLILLSLTALALLPSAATAAVPDEWVRWGIGEPDRTTWIRSLDFTAPGVVYAGGENDGIYNSVNSGATFAPDSGGLDANSKHIRQVVSSGGTLYAATGSGLFTKPVGGGNWSPKGQGAGPNKLNAAVQALIIDGSKITAGVASGGAYQSADGGDTWTKATGFPSSESVFWLEADKLAKSVVFAAAQGGVYRSTNGGSSWTLSSDGLPFSPALRIALAPDFSTTGMAYVATASGVYKTSTAGLSWSDASGSGPGRLADTKAKALLVTPSVFGGDIGRFIVGTENGVWATRDGGSTWGQMALKSALGEAPMAHDYDPATPDGGPGEIVWALGINPVAAPGRFFAGTQAHGVFQLPIQPVTAKSGGAPALSAPATPRTGLTATGTSGLWEGMGPYFFSYMWMRCTDNSNTGNCTETGDTDQTHTIVQADKNAGYLRLRVSAKGLVPPDPGDVFSAATAAIQDALLPAPTPPGGSFPRITGPDGPASSKSYEWGTTLTTEEGSWAAGVSFSYQWQRCDNVDCVAIPGATGKTYAPVQLDATKTLRVQLTGKNQQGTATDVTSGTTLTLIEKKPVNVAKPRIVGDAYAGLTLDSTAGEWSGFNITYFRSWLRCDPDGDTGVKFCSTATNDQTYTLTGADRGKRFQLRITASNRAGTADDTDAFSEATPTITDVPVVTPTPGPTATVAPTATPTGTPAPPKAPTFTAKLRKPKQLKKGAKLKLTLTLPGASQVKYQWLRNGKKIRKATKSSYKIARKDRGKKLSCRVSFTLGGAKKSIVTKAVKVPRKK